MENQRISINKLEGESDWVDWKFQIKIHLQAYGLMPVIEGKLENPILSDGAKKEEIEEYNKVVALNQKLEYQAQSIIVSSLTQQIIKLINMCRSAKEIWDKLRSIFEQRTEQRQDRLFNEFFGIKEKLLTDSIASHIAKLEKLWSELKDETWKEDVVDLPDSLFLNRVLNTLPSEYMEFVNAWESVPKEHRTINLLRERLCTVELRLREREEQEGNSTTALMAPKKKGHEKKRESQDKTQLRTKNGKIVSCYTCGGNHFKSNCPKISQTKQKSDKTCMMTSSAMTSMYRDDWIADSGATRHITRNREWFSSYKPFSEPKDILIGNGEAMKALGAGSINVTFKIGRRFLEGKLENVWYVPVAGCNLFSIPSAVDKNYKVIINKNICKIMSQQEVRAIAIRQDGLYKMCLKVQIQEMAAAVSHVNSLQVWHERLCHQNKRYVKSFLNNLGIMVSSDDGNEFCEACVEGKQHRLKFGKRSQRGDKPGDIISADVCGPMPVKSQGGARYFLCIKDDYSKFRSVYFLKEKSLVLNCIKQFFAQVRVQGHTIKEFITDGGKEFNNAGVKRLVEAAGVKHRITMPYTPEQNGAAERENRTLVEAARTMLHAQNLPEYLWAEAVNTAVYVLNRSAPTPVESKPPIELWQGTKSVIKHLKVFGLECFVHVPKQKRRKWDKKSIKGILVGYCDNKDGYRVWVPQTKSLLQSRDVVFKPECECDRSTERVIKHKENKVSVVENEWPAIHNVEGTFEESEAGGRIVTINASNTTDEYIEHSNNNCSFQEAVNHTGEDSEIPSDDRYNLRDRNTLRPPERYSDSNWGLVTCVEPETVKEALSSSDARKWKESMDEEYRSLMKNEVWRLESLPKGRKPVNCKWVFKIKPNADGTPGRYKSRLVAKGFSQKEGVDFQETFSPVARFDTVRTVLSVAAKENLVLQQFDVKTAFLYGHLEEEIYMVQPEGYHDGTDRCCRLQRSLYGLKQAPRCWNQRFSDYLKKTGLTQSTADPCLYIRKNPKIIVALYVDDGLVAGESKEAVDSLLKTLRREFEITSGPVQQYLGIEVKQTENKIMLTQSQYITKLLSRFRMSEANPISTPMELGFVQGEGNIGVSLEKSTPYREAIGCLMYLGVATRPDITFAVNHLAQYMQKPQTKHWLGVKRIFRYLKGTTNYGLCYSNSKEGLEMYSDADFASDPVTRKSVSGFISKFGGTAITWGSRKQRSLSQSTTEAEYIAANEAAKELVWLRRLLKEVSSTENIQGTPTLWVDNLGAVKLAKNPGFHKLTKHVDVRYHYIREMIATNEFIIEHIEGSNQVADLLTKPLPSPQFKTLVKKCGVATTTQSLGGSVEK